MTAQRVVPLRLQAGKRYVNRAGDVVTVEANPLWQAGNELTHCVMGDVDGEQGVLYFMSHDGRMYNEPNECALDIVRPHYELNGVYLDGFGETQELREYRQDKQYCFVTTDGRTFTSEGRYFKNGAESTFDLLDYADVVAVNSTIETVLKDAPAAIPLPAIPCRFAIGARVVHNEHGAGIVEDDDHADHVPYYVLFDNPVDSTDNYAWCNGGDMVLETEQPLQLSGVMKQVEEDEALLAALAEPALSVFGPDDMDACWATYRTAIRFGRSITIGEIIEARKQLLKA
jgi:hypothetical protein